MNNQIIDDVFHNLGTPGVRKLVVILTGAHHNREVAKDFDLSLSGKCGFVISSCQCFVENCCKEKI
jgi:hypothetical protein